MIEKIKKLRTERVGKQHRTIWLFLCDCGEEFEARVDKFKEGRIKSCGRGCKGKLHGSEK